MALKIRHLALFLRLSFQAKKRHFKAFIQYQIQCFIFIFNYLLRSDPDNSDTALFDPFKGIFFFIKHIDFLIRFFIKRSISSV